MASGGLALGCIPVEQGEVLYCALEDGERRMQFRMQQSTEDGAAWPSEMHFTHHAPRIDEGLVHRLRRWLQEHPRARLVMLDVLAKIQSPHHRGDDQYAGAHGDLGQLQALALSFISPSSSCTTPTSWPVPTTHSTQCLGAPVLLAPLT